MLVDFWTNVVDVLMIFGTMFNDFKHISVFVCLLCLMFGPMLVMSLMSLFLLIPRHGGGDGPKGNWIRRPRRGLPCWINYNIYKLYHQYLPYLQFLLALRVSPDLGISP